MGARNTLSGAKTFIPLCIIIATKTCNLIHSLMNECCYLDIFQEKVQKYGHDIDN